MLYTSLMYLHNAKQESCVGLRILSDNLHTQLTAHCHFCVLPHQYGPIIFTDTHSSGQVGWLGNGGVRRRGHVRLRGQPAGEPPRTLLGNLKDTLPLKRRKNVTQELPSLYVFSSREETWSRVSVDFCYISALLLLLLLYRSPHTWLTSKKPSSLLTFSPANTGMASCSIGFLPCMVCIDSCIAFVISIFLA